MVGGTVIESQSTCIVAGEYPGRQADVVRLWCMDGRHGDECAVYADLTEALGVMPGDRVWWQGRKIYWTRDGAFTEREIRKIGFSFDPRQSH